MAGDPRYESLAHRHQSYRHRGHYAEQLARVLTLFPRGQVHVIDSEAFFATPAPVYAALCEFLGLRPFQPARFDTYNARPGTPMREETRRMLAAYYRPHNTALAELLGRVPCWLGQPVGGA